MKRILLGIVLVGILSQFVLMNRAYAASLLPYTCDPNKGLYKETTILTVVPLDSIISKPAGISNDTFAKGLIYEFAYQRGNGTSPLHALLIDGELFSLACPYIDYTTFVVSGVTQGQFIVGTIGAVSGDMLQQIIDTYKITQIKQADIVSLAETKTPIALANEKNCVICSKLIVSAKGTESRDFKLEVSAPNYPKSIRQKEQVSLSIVLNNNGEFPFYGEGSKALQLVATNPSLSVLYHPSWLSPAIVSRISTTLLPGAQTTLAVTIGAPLQPGKYTETFQLKVGNTVVGKPFEVSFTVENDNYKLGKIVSKDDSPYANLRETPSLSGNILVKLDVGTVVIIKEEQDLWIKIETKEGKVGWVYRPFLRAL